jgi:hypothetical protein
VTWQRISRNYLWDISFYMLKPFIDQEVCNCIKDIPLSKISWGDLYTKYTLLNCMVLLYYTGIQADNIRNRGVITVYSSLQDFLDPIISFIHQDQKMISCFWMNTIGLQPWHWFVTHSWGCTNTICNTQYFTYDMSDNIY